MSAPTLNNADHIVDANKKVGGTIREGTDK
jgi:hypothetical protein